MAVYLGTNPVSVYNGGQNSIKIEEKTVTPGASNIEVLSSDGKYLSKVIVQGDENLIAENIKSGVNIFGQVGTLEGEGQYVWKMYENIPIVSWADGTDEQIVAMVEAADRGEINLADYWSVGDERQITLSAMDATGVGESHVEQTVTMVLMHQGGYELADGSTCNFVVGQKNGLAEKGYMNSSNTNSGSWDGCARRTWCNSVYYNAIPSGLRPIFKKFKTITAETYNGSTLKTSEDYFALPAEKEIFSSRTYSNSTEASALTQFEYYKTSANCIKKQGDSGSAAYWWERSPYADYSNYFCCVRSDGNASISSASYTYLLAPFGVI